MKYSSMATRVCVAAITLFSTTLCSAEAGSDPKAQVADALIKAEADAEVAILEARHAVAQGRDQTVDGTHEAAHREHRERHAGGQTHQETVQRGTE